VKKLVAVAVLFLGLSAFASDAPPLDAVKYPQDTPQSAIASIIKALEARDFAYWLGNMILPEESAHIAEKHGGLDKAAAATAEEKNAGKIAMRIALLHNLEKGKTGETERDGVKLFRFYFEKSVLQLEQQPDKLWRMNAHINSQEGVDAADAAAAQAKKDSPPAK
jgi:hypothetical protein